MTTRKSFTDLSDSERDKFLEAVITLKHRIANPTSPANQQVSVYDQFVALHGAAMNLSSSTRGNLDLGHGNALFLPWHRQYLLDFEKALQTVHADVSIPYWDWTKRQASRTQLFQDDFMGLIPVEQLSLASGYFAQLAPTPSPAWWPSGFVGWQVRSEFQSPNWQSLPDNLVRSLIRAGGDTANLPTGRQIKAIIDQVNDYNTFRIIIEHGNPEPFVIRTHDSGHNWVGGHMATAFSPLDPIFFMHHANVDRLWAEWQAVDSFRASDLPVELIPGIGRNDPMWPWVGNDSSYQVTDSTIENLMRDHSNDPLVSADDMLDIAVLGYEYA